MALFNFMFQDRFHALRSLDNPGLQSFPQLLKDVGSTIAPGYLVDDTGKMNITRLAQLFCRLLVPAEENLSHKYSGIIVGRRHLYVVHTSKQISTCLETGRYYLPRRAIAQKQAIEVKAGGSAHL